MSMNLVVLLYLVASICFIQALKGLSHPTTSIRGNLFGMSGMAIAVVTTAGQVERWDTKAVVTSVANTINASAGSLLEPPASKFVYSNVGTSGNIGLHEQAMVISTHSGTA